MCKNLSMRVAIRHHTNYAYDRLVFLTSHLLRLKPAAHCRTPIEAYSLTIKPENHFIHWQQDPFGNFIARIDFQEPLRQLSIEVELLANIAEINPFDFFIDDYAQSFPFTYDTQLEKDLSPYRELSVQGPYLTRWLARVDRSKREVIDFLIMLNQLVYQDIGYTIRLQAGVQTDEETLTLALGSCRDTAWLLVRILRQLGLAARFVSGYLIQLASAAELPDEPKEDFTALHAWTEVYIPGAGWIGLDPTSGLLAGEGHIPLACTPSPSGAAPVSGTAGESETIFTYTNTIKRLSQLI